MECRTDDANARWCFDGPTDVQARSRWMVLFVWRVNLAEFPVERPCRVQTLPRLWITVKKQMAISNFPSTGFWFCSFTAKQKVDRMEESLRFNCSRRNQGTEEDRWKLDLLLTGSEQEQDRTSASTRHFLFINGKHNKYLCFLLCTRQDALSVKNSVSCRDQDNTRLKC